MLGHKSAGEGPGRSLDLRVARGLLTVRGRSGGEVRGDVGFEHQDVPGGGQQSASPGNLLGQGSFISGRVLLRSSCVCQDPSGLQNSLVLLRLGPRIPFPHGHAGGWPLEHLEEAMRLLKEVGGTQGSGCADQVSIPHVPLPLQVSPEHDLSTDWLGLDMILRRRREGPTLMSLSSSG